MINPCNPCVCPGCPCEQCTFGYQTKEHNHQKMKELLQRYSSGEPTFPGRNCAEVYIHHHNDWKEEIAVPPKSEEPNRFATLAKDVRELYDAFRNECFTEGESIELTKTYLGIAFQDQMYRNMREPRKLNKSELAARLNHYIEERKEEEDS